MTDLANATFHLLTHLDREKIITLAESESLAAQTFTDLVLLLKQKLQQAYPDTKPKRLLKSVHYANGFPDEALKQNAFLLDDIEQYLTLNGFLDHDKSVAYFNARAMHLKGVSVITRSLLVRCDDRQPAIQPKQPLKNASERQKSLPIARMDRLFSIRPTAG